MIKNETTCTEKVMPKLINMIANCAKTVTFDNRKEFAKHTVLKISTY